MKSFEWLKTLDWFTSPCFWLMQEKMRINWVTENLRDELSWGYSGNLPLYTVNCHLFSSREENTIKINSTGGLCCILASLPPSFFGEERLVCQVSASLPTVATNTKPTSLSIPDTKLQSSQDPRGKPGCCVSVCDVLWMATNCCAACQHVKQGALERESGKLTSVNCQNTHVTVTHGSNGDDGFAWETFQQMNWHVTLNYSIAQILNVFLLYSFFGTP